MKGVPKRTEHRNWPIFSTAFRKIVHILADFGKRNTGGHANSFCQISNGYFEIIRTETENHTP